MTKREWSDRDLGKLFSGQSPENRDLARLKPMTDKIRSLADVDGSSAVAGDIASTLARVAQNSANSVGPKPARLRRTERNKTVTWKRRAGLAGLVALAASMGVAGAAAAADAAIPGDALYGVDRAFEARLGRGEGLLTAVAICGDLHSRGGQDHRGNPHPQDQEGHQQRQYQHRSGVSSQTPLAHAPYLIFLGLTLEVSTAR